MTAEWFNVIWQVAAVVFAAGAVWGELKAIRKDIARLEKKADESNHIKERLGVLEIKVDDHIRGLSNVYRERVAVNQEARGVEVKTL